MNEKQLRLKIYKEALEWVNTPWIHHQSVKGIGCDCIGLLIGVGNNAADLKFNWKDPKNYVFKGYSRLPEPPKMKAGMKANLDWIGVNYKDADIGDILWCRVDKQPHHVAILGPNGLIVHADAIPKAGAEGGKVVERVLRRDEMSKIIGVFRYKSVSRLM